MVLNSCMRIQFYLEWLKNKNLSFKDSSSQNLFSEYTERISKFTACEALGGLLQSVKKSDRAKIWVCDHTAGSRIMSSEEIAKELAKVLDGGSALLKIVIGGADGISKARIEEMKPSLRWSFGPLTLPHELASVVAAEQVYRAWAQIKGLPYHKGH